MALKPPLLTGNWYSKENLDKLILVRKINKDIAELIPKLAEALEIFYPDRWDIQFSSFANSSPHPTKKRYLSAGFIYKIDIIIFFPNIIISNEENERHNIKNLYSKVSLEISSIFKLNLRKVEALRLSTTKEEYLADYLYSHIPSGNIGKINWQSCCLGSSELVETISKFNIDNSFPFLKMLLLQLEGFFQWESLEGVPHIKMSSVNNLVPIDLNVSITDYEKEKVAKLISLIPNVEFAKVNIRIKNKRLIIVNDDCFMDFLILLFTLEQEVFPTRIQILNSNDNFRDLFCVSSEIGKYYSLFPRRTTPNHFIPILETTPLIFKSKKFFAFIQPSTETVQISERKIIFKPNIVTHAKRIIESYLNKERAKNYAIKVLHSS